MASTALANPAAPITLRQTGTFVPRPGYFPATGDDTIAGGIFCISLPDLAAYLQRTGNNPGATGSESPRQVSPFHHGSTAIARHRPTNAKIGGKAPSLKVPAHTQRK